MRLLYTFAAYLLVPVVSGLLLWRGVRDRSYWQNFGERFGFGARQEVPGIWIHAVSVGEVQAAAALVQALRQRHPQLPLLVTTTTPTGAARARALFGEGVAVRFLPFDLPGAVRRFFDAVRPRIAVIFETELWPNLYRECGRRRVPLVLASARVSPRSVARYRRLAGLFREMLAREVLIAAQGEGDAERFREIGAAADRTHVTGNIKFDFTPPPDTAARGRELRERYAAGRPVWVAGSTHPGEEQQVLEAHRLVLRTQPDALLVLAPRHPHRFADVAAWLANERMRIARRSRHERAGPEAQVLLVDTLGELLAFYAAGDVAFVGGSLVPIGGHNLLEPAALGLPILTGPHTANAADVSRLLVGRGAAVVVADAQQLGTRVAQLLTDAAERVRIGEIGRAAVQENRGALDRLLALIEPLLER